MASVVTQSDQTAEVLTQCWSKMGPKWVQNGSKRGSQNGSPRGRNQKKKKVELVELWTLEGTGVLPALSAVGFYEACHVVGAIPGWIAGPKWDP